MDQDHRSAGQDHAGFGATRWSLVLEAAQSHAEGAPEALARICECYWSPLYAFARHRGFSPEDAQDLVQGFFEHLIESRALSAVDQAKGRQLSELLPVHRSSLVRSSSPALVWTFARTFTRWAWCCGRW